MHRRSWGTAECDCPRPPGRYRKANAFSCRCRGKRKGTPKLAGSLHKAGYKYRQTAMRRIWNRRLTCGWLAAAWTRALEESELPSGSVVGRRQHTRTW
jgi:hypothetical protein